jgi:hypothetical protein
MDPFGQVWNNMGKNKTEEVLADSRETLFTCQLLVNDPYPHYRGGAAAFCALRRTIATLRVKCGKRYETRPSTNNNDAAQP